MHIGAIDHSAANGTSWLHRASPLAKLAAFALVLTAVIVSWNVLVVVSITLMLVAVVSSARLSFRLTYSLAAYPALFAIIFALSAAPNLSTGILFMLKAITAALAAIIITLTTPYPQIFAPIQRVMPTLVGDAMLMTYRSSFLLLERFTNMLRAARLRAGIRSGHPVRSARLTASALGGLLLYSFDLSVRDYEILRLRGYEGRLRTVLPASESRLHDGLMLLVATFTLMVSVIWRISSVTLNPFSWIVPLVPAAAVLATTLLFRRNQ